MPKYGVPAKLMRSQITSLARSDAKILKESRANILASCYSVVEQSGGGFSLHSVDSGRGCGIAHLGLVESVLMETDSSEICIQSPPPPESS